MNSIDISWLSSTKTVSLQCAGKRSAGQEDSASGDDEDESRAHAIKKRPAQSLIQRQGDHRKKKNKLKNSKT